jgi:hypothetical protein
MKIFIFGYVDQLTENYHSGGGLNVIAKNQEQVEELVKADECIKLTQEDWDKVTVYELNGFYTPTYYIFPDAGCC